MKHPARKILTCILILVLLTGSVLAVNTAPKAYLELFPVETETETAEILASSVESVLNGRSILLFGDSLLSGYGLGDINDSWTKQLSTVYGMNMMNCAISGSTFAVADQYGYKPGGCYEPYADRTLNRGKYDIIYVAGGGNDWYCEIPLGSDYDSRDKKTFVGAVNTVIDNLQRDYPDSLILFSTSWDCDSRVNGLGLTPNDYNAAMLEVCARRGIACFAACDPAVSGITAGPDLFLNEEDIWHLNAKGHAKYLPVIASWLEKQWSAAQEQAASSSDLPFADVKTDDWFHGAVKYAYENGLMNGVSETKFDPNGEMTRAMLVTVLYRAAGSPTVEGMTMPFTDVPAGEYYTNAVLWAYRDELVNGMDETHFDPDGTLTRQQLATILYRLASRDAVLPETGDLGQFTDSGAIHDYAKSPMTWAVGVGILQGMGDGTLAPEGNTTRAQVATMLMRYLEQYPMSRIETAEGQENTAETL